MSKGIDIFNLANYSNDITFSLYFGCQFHLGARTSNHLWPYHLNNDIGRSNTTVPADVAQFDCVVVVVQG